MICFDRFSQHGTKFKTISKQHLFSIFHLLQPQSITDTMHRNINMIPKQYRSNQRTKLWHNLKFWTLQFTRVFLTGIINIIDHQPPGFHQDDFIKYRRLQARPTYLSCAGISMATLIFHKHLRKRIGAESNHFPMKEKTFSYMFRDKMPYNKGTSLNDN